MQAFNTLVPKQNGCDLWRRYFQHIVFWKYTIGILVQIPLKFNPAPNTRQVITWTNDIWRVFCIIRLQRVNSLDTYISYIRVYAHTHISYILFTILGTWSTEACHSIVCTKCICFTSWFRWSEYRASPGLLTTRSREVSKPRDSSLEFFNRSEI